MLKPGDTIGILGGGQLGRMLVLAAAPLGLKTVVFAPEPDCPAFESASRYICAGYDDQKALQQFIDLVDVVSYEFENVPLSAAHFIEERMHLAPNARSLEISQDRFLEKSFIHSLDIPSAAFLPVNHPEEMEAACHQIGFPCVLKTRRLGYDGKGQFLIRSHTDIDTGSRLVEQAACILESFVVFEHEVSMIIARSGAGEVSTFDLCLNRHKNHILDETELPSGLPAGIEDKAKQIAGQIAEALNYIGILTVELFVVRNDSTLDLIVNEIAPRVHNSGHWTIEGAATSQFEQHIRALCGWPLGDSTQLGNVLMKNLIGSDYHNWFSWLQKKGAHLHLYGKTDVREGRKMGHVTCIEPFR